MSLNDEILDFEGRTKSGKNFGLLDFQLKTTNNDLKQKDVS